MLDEIVNFGIDDDDDLEDNLMKRERQIYREIAFINAARDTLSIPFKGTKTVSWEQVVAWGSNIAPAILGDDRLFFNNKRLNPLFEEYRERSEALTLKEGKDISMLEAINRDILGLQDLIKAGHRDLVVLRKKERALVALAHELASSSHTETNLIIRDVYKVERGLPYEDHKDSRDFKVTNDRGIRIRVFHPDHFEHITGADLIYECYSEQYRKVRVAAIQYKIRRSKTVYIDERIEKQLERLENTFCNREACQMTNIQKNSSYRFPYCSAFLRPTDEIQPSDPRFISHGYYVPICAIKEVRKEKTLDNPDAIPSKRLRDHAVSHKVFEELFNADMLGSKWMTYDELEAMYQSKGVLEPHQSITIHAQEFTLNTDKRHSRSKKTRY